MGFLCKSKVYEYRFICNKFLLYKDVKYLNNFKNFKLCIVKLIPFRRLSLILKINVF